MKNTIRSMVLLVLGIACFIGCNGAKKDTFDLRIGFLHHKPLMYSFAATLAGSVVGKDTSIKYDAVAEGMLACTSLTDSLGTYRVHFKNVTLVGNLLDSFSRVDFIGTLHSTAFYLDVNKGLFFCQDSAFKNVSALGSWDVVRAFARSLPVIPQTSQSVGAQWEREKSGAIVTKRGDFPARIYQQTTLDKVTSSKNGIVASLSNQFRYSLDNTAMLDTAIVAYVPPVSRGGGSALVNCTQHILIRATATFSAKSLPLALPNISILETVQISLVNDSLKEGHHE